jgi:hypothetical protein
MTTLDLHADGWRLICDGWRKLADDRAEERNALALELERTRLERDKYRTAYELLLTLRALHEGDKGTL